MSIKVYLGFDDTDNLDSPIGTGKVARRFEDLLPAGSKLWGVVRQQLLVDDRIPYTSHNSSACLIVLCPNASCMETIIEKAIHHIEQSSVPGSDPGLCMVCEGDAALNSLISFGRLCTKKVVTQEEALRAAAGIHLSGHGGTCDGIIGAAAAVGLTASGWSGRFIEFGRLRAFSDAVSVAELEASGILVVSLDRDVLTPLPTDRVATGGWLRPRLWGHHAVLPVHPEGANRWRSIGEKRNKQQTSKEV